MPKLPIAALAAAGALVAAAPAAARSAPLVDARGCLASLHVFLDDAARVQPAFLPRPHRPMGWVPGKVWLTLWSFACPNVKVDGDAARPVRWSIAAPAIEHPDPQAGDTAPVELPNLWSHYVHRLVSDDRGLVRALARRGFPARHVPGMTFTRTAAPGLARPLGVHTSEVTAPGTFASWTRPVVPQEPAHSHVNDFWVDRSGGGHGVLELRVASATDHFCELAAGRTCGTVTAPPGSELAAYLGAPDRSADAAVDHDRIDRVLVFDTSR